MEKVWNALQEHLLSLWTILVGRLATVFGKSVSGICSLGFLKRSVCIYMRGLCVQITASWAIWTSREPGLYFIAFLLGDSDDGDRMTATAWLHQRGDS